MKFFSLIIGKFLKKNIGAFRVVQVVECLPSKHEAPSPKRQLYKDTIYLFTYLAVLGFELRAYTLSHISPPFFVMGFFEIGSPELFARAGFEPQFS
jgi:hypothetical protein